MNITINSKNLLKAAQKVGGCIKSSNTLPILDCLLLHAYGNEIILTASDNEIRATTKVAATVERQVDCCIDYNQITGILKSFPSAPVELEFSDKYVKLVCGESRYVLPVSDFTAFPKTQNVDWQNPINMDTDDLCSSLKRAVKFTDPTDDFRGIRNVIVQSLNNNLKVKAMTAFMAFSESVMECPQDFKVLLSNRAASFLATQPIEEETMVMDHTDSNVRFSTETTTITIIQPEQSPPDVDKLLEGKEINHRITVNKENFIRAINALMQLSAVSFSPLKLDFTKKEVVINCDDKFLELKGKEVCIATLEGEEFTTGFNGKILATVLGMVDGEEATLEVADPKRMAFVNTGKIKMLATAYGI